MRAVVVDRYGPPDVQRLEDVERPVPKADEVLIKIHATTVTRTDCGIREAKPFFIRFIFGLRRPKQPILGTELAGEVEAIGAAVTQFAIGDQGIVGRQVPAGTILVRRHVIAGRQMALQHLELLAVFEANDVIVLD